MRAEEDDQADLMRYEEDLGALVLSNPWLLSVLRAVREVSLPQWAVTSGVLRNLVWDDLHGYRHPAPVKDVDVAFFDARDLSRERDRLVEQELEKRLPDVPWEVTNQAGVHLWYEEKFGRAIFPIASLEDGIARNPETATSVGVRLEPDDRLTVVAPWGLDDLFTAVLRLNPNQVSRDYFLQRLREKLVAERWPQVTVIDDWPGCSLRYD